MKKYLLSIFVLLFIGCGGGGGGSSSSSSSSSSSNSSGTTITAVDGYIKDATLSDSVGNKATYSSKGKYTFTSTPTYPLTLSGGKLEATDANFDINMTAQNGSSVISPITTFLGNDSTLLSKFANLGLGISTLDEFSVDYVNSNNLNLSKLSQLLYVILKDETLTATFKANINVNEGSLDNLFTRAATDINNSSLSPAKKSESTALLTKVKSFTGSASAMEDFISDEKSNFQSIIHDNVRYNSVKSPHTGRVWLDRNLGASSVCTAYNDSSCYGDYYQWGRETDGHEKSNSSTTLTQAAGTSVGHGNFITRNSSPYDWTTSDSSGSVRNTNWSKTDGTSICPIGFKVPSFAELKADTVDLSGFNNRDDAYSSFLKLPSSGARDFNSGSFTAKGSTSFIWSSSPYASDADHVSLSSNNKYYLETLRAYGISIRCIQEKIAPIANAGNNQTVTEGENITLNATLSTDKDGNIVSYEWKEASTVLSNNQVFSKLDFSIGTHTITLTVTDNHGLTDTDTVSVIIKDDHGDDISTSTTISNTTINGEIEQGADVDFFKIIITDPGELELFSTSGSDTQGYLYDSSGAELALDDDSGISENFRIIYDVTPATYYLKVKLYDSSSTGLYIITKNFTTDRPSISSSIPTHSATDVGVSSIITVIFNEEIDQSSFTNNIFFKDSSNNAIAFTTTYTNQVLKIITSDLLNTTTSYTITFSSNIKDLNNNALIQDDITFTTSSLTTIVHNTVTYGFVKSDNGTGKIWLDRNLGASSVCTSYDDSTCFGDYYQWGREADGHEKLTNTTYDDPIADLTSSSDFITVTTQFDWTTADSDGSIRSANWSKTDGSSICPIGFRVPTIDELEAETVDLAGFNNIYDAYSSFLKIPSADGRAFHSGLVSNSSTSCSLWTSTPNYNAYNSAYFGSYVYMTNNSKESSISKIPNGFPVRCIRN